MASRVINKEIEQVAIDLLKHHPRNANQGDVEAIKKSLAVNGWYGSVVANLSTKHILAGNHRVMAAKALGWETVPVQWVDVTPEEELRILVVDNRTTRIGQDDTTKITDILAELANTPIGLEGTGYGAADLDALIDELAGMTEPAELLTDPDEVPEDVETRCQPGDLWILGRHRLLCGDSTKADDVARLMDGKKANMVFTDPPYNVDYGASNNPRHKHRKIKNDSMSDADWDVFVNSYLKNVLNYCDGNIYIAMSDKELGHLQKTFMNLGGHWSSFIIWVKDRFVLSAKDYHSRHESILYGWREGVENRIRLEDRTQDDVWEIPRPKTSDEHPTMKPVELVVKAIENSSSANGIIYEPFCGSGTTLVASEQTNRICFAIELDAHYCDVIIQRWENATGQKAVLDGR